MKLLNLGCGNRFDKDWINIDFSSCHPSVRAHNLLESIPLPDSYVDLVYHSHLLEHFPRSRAVLFLGECRRVLKPGGVIRVAAPDLEGITRAYLQSLEDAKAGKKGGAERHEWMTIELLDQMVREKSGGEMLAYLSQETIPAEEFIFKRLGTEAKRIVENVRAANKKGVLSSLKGLVVSARSGKGSDRRVAVFRRSGEVHKWMYDSYSLRRAMEASGFTGVVDRNASESYISEWAKYNLDTEPDGSVYKPDSFYMEGRRPGS